MKQKAFFLDRDGTLNVDYNYVHTKDEWTWCDGAIDALKIIQSHGFKIIVVTNQSGIVKGKYKEQHVEELHGWVDQLLKNEGIPIDSWNIAPHHPEFDSAPHDYPPEDRKPGTGMFLKSTEALDVDFNSSFMAGDKISDLKPAIELGMTPIFIRSRHEPSQDKQWLKKYGISTYNTLLEAVEELL